MDVALALAAALLFSLGTVLQQRVARELPDSEAGGAGLLVKLARRPAWLVGVAADGLGFLAQAAALAVGRLVVVQPLLATSVVFALPLGARLDGRRVGRRDLVGAAAVTGGLAAFLVLADPTGGVDDATAAGWIVIAVVATALCGGLVVAARGRAAAPRAALLGTAAGILFGISAALTKAVVDTLTDDGVVALATDWHTYALVAVGWASMTLSQASLQTGALAPAVATQMSMDPIASLFLGTLAFQEQIHDTALGAFGALLGIAAMVAGLAILARSQAAGDGGGGSGVGGTVGDVAAAGG
ncbi:MAG: DMT family transporter [Solirubrobacterales bacterium]|nr:DMT family transporter [Solirubrobacterales bacterium]